MCNDNKLRLRNEFLERGHESAYVGFVEGCIEFVEKTEWAGLDHVNSEQQSHSRQRSFSARKQRYVLQPFAGWPGDDLDAALKHIFLVDQNQLG